MSPNVSLAIEDSGVIQQWYRYITFMPMIS